MMNYRICLAKGDVRFEVEGDKKFVLELLAKYDDHEAVPFISASGGSARTVPVKADLAVVQTQGKKTSVGEFIRQMEVKKHMDLVVAFGYYLEKIGGLTSFTGADINNCYYEAKIENSNTSQMIIQNIKKGFMMAAKSTEEKGKQAFVLTRSGEEYVVKHPAKKAK